MLRYHKIMISIPFDLPRAVSNVLEFRTRPGDYVTISCAPQLPLEITYNHTIYTNRRNDRIIGQTVRNGDADSRLYFDFRVQTADVLF